jgi:rhodanese-related sulfurtransferase
MRGVAEQRLAEMDRLVKTYLGERESLESIGFNELASRVRARDVVVVDVRPRPEYDAGHIAGAISIPHDEVKRRLGELPRNKEIVAYCRGPYCVFADEAVKTLRAHKRKALRLDGGLPEWRAAGRAVERSPALEIGDAPKRAAKR